jgi:hypothetical protein
VERHDPPFGEDGAVKARPVDDLGAVETTRCGEQLTAGQRWRQEIGEEESYDKRH